MATTALSKAIKTLERREKSDARKRIETKAQNSQLLANATAAAGVAAGAAADKRFGEGEEAATWGETDVPVNATAGPLLFVGGLLLRPGMARDVVGGAGFGMSLAALYRFVHDKVPKADAEG